MRQCKDEGEMEGTFSSIPTVVVDPSRSMEEFENRYFKLNRILISLGGLSYTQSCRKRMLRPYIISFMLLFRLAGQVCQLFTLNFDVRSSVPVLQSLIPGFSFSMLYFTCLLHSVTVQKIFSCIRQDWQQLQNNVELKIMRKHAFQTKLFTWTCGLLFYLYICFSVIPLVLRKFLSKNEVMRNTDRFPVFSCYNYLLNRDTFYYPIITYQAIILIISTTVGVSCFSTYFWFIQHTCARLSIIKTEMHRPFVNSDTKDFVPVMPVDLSHWMIGIIKNLTRTAKFMNLVNTVAEQCYLFQMMLAFFIVVIDFLCIPSMLEHNENKKDILAFVVLILSSIFPLYINCHIGQKLIDYSVDVYKEACMVPIHEISLKTQKLLLTVLLLTAKPYTLSIGKFFVSSHEFFSDLVRTSLSFSLVLRTTQRN